MHLAANSGPNSGRQYLFSAQQWANAVPNSGCLTSGIVCRSKSDTWPSNVPSMSPTLTLLLSELDAIVKMTIGKYRADTGPSFGWTSVNSNSRIRLPSSVKCYGPTTAAFFDCLNLPTFSWNLAQYWPCIKPIVIFTMAFSSESRTANVRPMSAHYWAMCHFYHGKPFWKWENQSSAQHWPVAVPKTSAGGQSLGQHWSPSAYRIYHSSNGTILAADLRQIFGDAGPVLGRI